MPRKLRVEYWGAIYNVMNRGDQREDIFRDDEDHPHGLISPFPCDHRIPRPDIRPWNPRQLLSGGLVKIQVSDLLEHLTLGK